MNRAPDRKTTREDHVRTRLSKEPEDWFSVDPISPALVEYHIDDLKVLTCDTKEIDRTKSFLEKNKDSGFNFTIFEGKSGSLPSKMIFDNYLEILEKGFSDPECEIIPIVEDDVLFLKGAKDYLEKAMKALPKEWDIISGNYSRVEKIVLRNRFLISPRGHASSMNFTIFHRRSYEKILKNLHKRDYSVKSHYNHFDRFCFSPDVEMNSYCTWPMICKETPGYSVHHGEDRDIFSNLVNSEPYKYWFLGDKKFS